MRKAAIYCRVSTEEQRERETIKTQLDSTRRRCQAETLPLHDCYLDYGLSGTVPFEQRPAAARLLHDARQGFFNVLVI